MAGWTAASSTPASLAPLAAVAVASRAVDPETGTGDFRARAFAAWPDRLRGWLPTIVGVWAAGVGLLSLRLFAGWRAIRRLRGAAREIDDPVWIGRFADLRGRLGVSRAVRLLSSASATVPFVVGWLRPVVLVPAGLLTGLTPSELEAIFAHELAHIRRHDFLVNLLQNVVETLLFYHPAVWWMSSQIRKEREHCCDDVAAAVCGGALGYAKALVALEQLRPATGLVVAVSGGSLLERIRRLAGASASGAHRSAWPLPALGLFLGAAIALVAAGESSQGQQKEEHRLPTTFTGGEIIARVGPEVILASDVLPDANRQLQKVLERNVEPPPAGEIERLRKLYVSKFLERVIETKLVIVEARRSLPEEAWGKIEKQFNEQFDKEYLKKMLDSEECRSRTELDRKLRKAGSSLEALRRQAFENSFAQHWMEEKVKVGREVTDERVRDYYQSHDDLAAVPFADVEAFIRKLIHDGRLGARRLRYRANLRTKIPVWNIFEPAAGEFDAESTAEPGGQREAGAALPAEDGTAKPAVGTEPAIGDAPEAKSARTREKTPTDEANAEADERLRIVQSLERGQETLRQLTDRFDSAGIMVSVVDAETKQPIPRFRVLAGSKDDALFENVKKRHPGVRYNWLPGTLREGEKGAIVWPADRNERGMMALRVEADGYQPQTSDWFAAAQRPARLDFALVADAGIVGRVLQPDGKPAKRATLAITIAKTIVPVANGQMFGGEEVRWWPWGRAKTDAEGNFRLPTETDPGAAVVIVHESGTVDMSLADLRNQPQITLKPWGRIVGQVLWKDRVGADEPVGAMTSRSSRPTHFRIRHYTH